MPNLCPNNVIDLKCTEIPNTGFDVFSSLRFLRYALVQWCLKLCNLHLKTPAPTMTSTEQKAAKIPALESSLLFSVYLFNRLPKQGALK